LNNSLKLDSNQVTILVNSTDSFRDCWNPFFKLFKNYWSNCPYKIVLNTDTKTFSYPGLNIESSQVSIERPEQRLSWSDCLIRCLDKIESKYILYLQEDYFLNTPVDTEMLDRFLTIMKEEDYSHIRIMELGGSEPYEKETKYPLLWKLPQKANYRIGLQAGLWKTERLRFYLQPGESGWQFERAGTLRAKKVEDSFYCQNMDYFNRQGKYIFPYKATGIVKGKWFEPAVVDLFQQHNIEVDYSVRGFYQLNHQQRLVNNIRKQARKLFMTYVS
jgi:hypothetical protein